MGLGDIRLTIKKPLISSDNLGLSMKGDAELPIGSAKKGYGNGSFDAGIALFLDKSISKTIMIYWNFGAVFPGDLRGYQRVNLKDFIYGGTAVEVDLKKGFSVLAQLQWQLPIYPKTDFPVIDRVAYLLSLGGRYYLRNSSLEFSVVDDINDSGAPDVMFNLLYNMRL